MSLTLRSFSLNTFSFNKNVSSVPSNTTRELRFQGHRTLQFETIETSPIETSLNPTGTGLQTDSDQDKISKAKNIQQALHQFAKTFLSAFPGIHLLSSRLGQNAIIVTVNPIQKTMDIFYTDLLQSFLGPAMLNARREMALCQPENGSSNVYFESGRPGSHNGVDMPPDLPTKWESWLATKGLTPLAAESDSPISPEDPYAMTLKIGTEEPTIQKLQPLPL
jgi:hypothetical protein